MTPESTAAWVSAVAAVGSLVAAMMAWQSAKESAKATQQLTDIEAARRHEELTPKLSVKVEPFNAGDTQSYRLIVGLDEPAALIKLDRLSLKVRDDRSSREHMALPGMEATPERIRAQVWGPLRFAPRLGPDWARADDKGRSVQVTRPLDVGESLIFAMERTVPPPWYRDFNSPEAMWREDVGGLLRLSVEAVSVDGDRPWLLPVEVDLVTSAVEGFGPRPTG